MAGGWVSESSGFDSGSHWPLQPCDPDTTLPDAKTQRGSPDLLKTFPTAKHRRCGRRQPALMTMTHAVRSIPPRKFIPIPAYTSLQRVGICFHRRPAISQRLIFRSRKETQLVS